MPILQHIHPHSFKTVVGFLLLAASISGLIRLLSEMPRIAIFRLYELKKISFHGQYYTFGFFGLIYISGIL